MSRRERCFRASKNNNRRREKIHRHNQLNKPDYLRWLLIGAIDVSFAMINSAIERPRRVKRADQNETGGFCFALDQLF